MKKQITSTIAEGDTINGQHIVVLKPGERLERLNDIQLKVMEETRQKWLDYIFSCKNTIELFELNGQVFAVVGSDGAFHQHIKETDVTDNVFTINRNISNCDHTKDCQIAPGVYAIGLDRQYDPHQEVWEKNPD